MTIDIDISMVVLLDRNYRASSQVKASGKSFKATGGKIVFFLLKVRVKLGNTVLGLLEK